MHNILTPILSEQGIIYLMYHTYIMQVMTLSGWSQVMYYTQQSVGDGIGCCYFVLFAVIGFYFLIQLLLATLTGNYHGNPESELKREEKKARGDHEDVRKTYLNELIDRYFPVVQPEDMPSWRRKLRNLVESTSFENFVIFLVVINTAVLSTDHYPSDDKFDAGIDAVNFVLAILFLGEMICKICGLGIREYCSNSFNVQDGTIVTISIIEIMIMPPPVLGGSGGGSSLSVLRSFRLLKLFRIFSAMSKNKKMRMLFNALATTAAEMQNFLILLLLLLFIYTLLGMQLFANKLRFGVDGNPITEIGSEAWLSAPNYQSTIDGRYNFDDFPSAFGTVYQIVTMDNWEVCMLALRRSQGSIGVIYVISLVVIGAFVLMNLFLAILLYELDSEQSKIQEEEKLSAPNPVHNSSRREVQYEEEGAEVSHKHQHNLRHNRSMTSIENFILDSPTLPNDLVEVGIGNTHDKNDSKHSHSISLLDISTNPSPSLRDNHNGHLLHNGYPTTHTIEQLDHNVELTDDVIDYSVQSNLEPGLSERLLRNEYLNRISHVDEMKIDFDRGGRDVSFKSSNGGREASSKSNYSHSSGLSEEIEGAEEYDDDEREYDDEGEKKGGDDDGDEGEEEEEDEEEVGEFERYKPTIGSIYYIPYKLQKMREGRPSYGTKYVKKGLTSIAPPLMSENSSKDNEAGDEKGADSDGSESNNDMDEKEAKIFPLEPINTLMLFGPENKFRLMCARVLNNHMYDLLIINMILVSTLTLAIDSPLLNPNDSVAIACKSIDWITSLFFTVEMLLKFVCGGAYGSKVGTWSY